MRDPYGVYARYVLRLHRLDPPGRRPDALTRGKLIHAALDDFVTATAAGLPPDAARLFRDTVAAALAAHAPWPAVQAIWTARLARAAGWFLDGEAARRARGAPAARELKGRREVEGLARPFAITARADRIDRVAGRLCDLRLQVRHQPLGRRGEGLPPAAAARSRDRRGRRLRGPAARPRRGTSSS